MRTNYRNFNMRRSKLNKYLLLVLVTVATYFSILVYFKDIEYEKKNLKTVALVSVEANKTVKECINDKKYLRFECKKPLCGGWADRLRGLMSAYVWAIFTKRDFLIDIDYPCSLESMLEPNIVKWNTPIKCYDYENENNKFFVKYMNKISDRSFYLGLRHIDIFDYYNEANLLIVQNNLDWIYSFSSNPNLENKIKEFGFDPKNFKLYYFFRRFYNELFKLTPQLQKRYDHFLKIAKPNDKTKLICAQIRIGGVRPNVAWDSQFMPLNSSKLFWEFINNKFIKQLKPDEKYKLFVTTDTESVEAESIQEFGIENIVKFEGAFVHIDREPEEQGTNCSRINKVILDFHALQTCDMVVISQSGYGRLGISIRPNPTENLYRYQVDEAKLKSHKIEKFIFKKIDSLNEL